jgi:diguanylate cyclase (GGDEF)-like protein
MHQQIRTFLNGFIIILVMMVASALFILQLNHEAGTSVRKAFSHQLEKLNTIHELLATASERLELIQYLLLKKDNFANVRDKQKLEELEQKHFRVSEKLLPLLNAKEGEILLANNRLNLRISELNTQISVLLEHGGANQATKVLLEEVLPDTERLLQNIHLLIDLQRENSTELLSLSDETADANRQRFMLYALFTIFASLAVGSIAVYSGNKLTRQLEEMNNYLEEKISERTESLLDTQKELLEDNTNLARLASTDPLTGLFNRNYMNDILQREYSRYQRYGQLFGIILIDVDHFKRVNDIHGHDVGDMVLTQVAQQLKAAVRNTDFVGRWGGEEFLICCSTTDTGDIEAIAENVRIIIAESEFEIVENLTVSLGCALIHPKEDIGSLIKRSDVALYEAKHGGRNQTKVSTADM